MSDTEFNVYYRAIYGERWDGLRERLCSSGGSTAYSTGLTKPYFLNAASVFAAKCLRLMDALNNADDGDNAPVILDACAAPGGKTLVLASLLPEAARLIANELSAERRRRMSRVLRDHLPEATQEKITVTGFDAAALASRKSERGRFAAILLDVPCSSEAHVLQSAAHLAAWTPARPKALANRQWALLSAGLLLLKSGGSLVYSTC